MGVVWERCALCSGVGPERSQDGFRMCTLDPNSKVHRTKVLSSMFLPWKGRIASRPCGDRKVGLQHAVAATLSEPPATGCLELMVGG